MCGAMHRYRNITILSNYTMVVRLDHRAVTRLMCQVLEHVVRFLSDLVQALRTSADQSEPSMEWTGARHRQAAVRDRAGRSGRKMGENLPDLIADLPIDHGENNPTMTLCNAQPDLSLPASPRSFRMTRQTSSTKRRRALYHHATCTRHVTNEATSQQPPCWENSCNCNIDNNYINYQWSYAGGRHDSRVAVNMNANLNHNDIIPMSNNNNNNNDDDGNNNTTREDRLTRPLHAQISEGNTQHHGQDINGNQSFVGPAFSNLFRDSNEDQVDSPMSPVQDDVTRAHQAPTFTNNSHRLVRCARSHGNNDPLEYNHQRQESPVCPSCRAGNEQWEFPINAGALGNPSIHPTGLDYGENTDNNAELPGADERLSEVHHEFTSELVLALRNIGDHLDTRLGQHDQFSAQAIFGNSKLQLRNLIVTVLRHQNVVGMALSATLQMCLLFRRL